MYENGKMRSVETISGMGGQRRMMEDLNTTMICHKNFCKYHIIPIIKNKRILLFYVIKYCSKIILLKYCKIKISKIY
jgi:hypothetical protein